MNPGEEQTILAELLARLSDVERAHTRLAEINTRLAAEVASLRSEQADRPESKTVHVLPVMQGSSEEPDAPARSSRGRSRRNMLRKSIAAAASVVGAGALLEASTGTAHGLAYMPADNTGSFSSSTSGTPAVTAVGTSGAHGIDIGNDNTYGLYSTSSSGVAVLGQSDSGTGVTATSNSGTALVAQSTSSTGIAVTSSTGVALTAGSTDNYGIRASSLKGIGIYATAYGGNPAISGEASTTNSGVEGVSTGGYGVYGVSSTNAGIYAMSRSGPALIANGPIQVLGNSVGKATIPSGATSVTVTTSAATANSNILLTPLANPKGDLWVTQAAGSFTIHTNASHGGSLSIAYLIIN